MESVDEHVALCSLEETAPVIENDLHGRDDDGDGNDEDNGEADVQVLPDPGELLPVEKKLKLLPVDNI